MLGSVLAHINKGKRVERYKKAAEDYLVIPVSPGSDPSSST